MPRKKTPKLFLSHSSKDKEIVLRLATDLENSGIRVWLDRWELQAGDSIIDKISEGIGISDYLAVFLSPTSLKSEWVRKEVNAGLMKELERKSVSVIVALLPNCHNEDIPLLLKEKLWIDFRTSYLTGLSDFLEVFRKTKKAADILFGQGTRLIQNNQIDDAIPILKSVLEKYPAHYDAMQNLGVAYQYKKMNAEALEIFKTLVHEQPDTAIYKAGLGWELIKNGQRELGLEQLRKAVKMDPDNLDIRIAVAEAFQNSKLYRDAKAEFEEILRRDRENTRALYGLGGSLSGLYEIGETNEIQPVIEIYRKVVEKRTSFAGGFNDLGTALARSGNVEEAVQNFEKAVALSPQHPDALKNLAMAYFELGRIPQSINLLESLIENNLNNIEYHSIYAEVLFSLGRIKEAVKQYYKILDLEPDNEEAKARLAQALRIHHSTEAAVGNLSKVTLTNPDGSIVKEGKQISNYLAKYVILKTGFVADNPTSSINLFINKLSPIIMRAQGLFESDPIDSEELSKLIHDIDQIEIEDTEDDAVNVLRNDILGTIAFVLKKYKDAIFHYRKSLELNPFVFWIHNNLAAAYYEDEQYGLAIDEWERAFDQYPDDGIPLIHIAFAYAKLQLVPQAIRAYERFVELFPNDELASGIKDMLEDVHKLD